MYLHNDNFKYDIHLHRHQELPERSKDISSEANLHKTYIAAICRFISNRIGHSRMTRKWTSQKSQ